MQLHPHSSTAQLSRTRIHLKTPKRNRLPAPVSVISGYQCIEDHTLHTPTPSVIYPDNSSTYNHLHREE